MAVFGWIVCIVIVFYLTIVGVLLGYNFLGTYRLGGKCNTWIERTLYLLLGPASIVGMWYVLYHYSPFTVSLK